MAASLSQVESEKGQLFVSGVKWDRNSVLSLLPLIDCDGCASQGVRSRCCSHPWKIMVKDDEISRIAAFTRRHWKKLTRKWKKVEGGYQIQGPCEFLMKTGECGIWSVRPVVCKYFPLQRVPHPDTGDQVVGVFTGWCNAGRRCIEQLGAWQR